MKDALGNTSLALATACRPTGRAGLSLLPLRSQLHLVHYAEDPSQQDGGTRSFMSPKQLWSMLSRWMMECWRWECCVMIKFVESSGFFSSRVIKMEFPLTTCTLFSLYSVLLRINSALVFARWTARLNGAVMWSERKFKGVTTKSEMGGERGVLPLWPWVLNNSGAGSHACASAAGNTASELNKASSGCFCSGSHISILRNTLIFLFPRQL